MQFIKGGFKGCREQWVDGFDDPPSQSPAEQYPGGSGELSKQVKATHDRGNVRGYSGWWGVPPMGLDDLSATFAYIAHHCRVTQWPEVISVLPSHILHITTGWHNGLNDLSATFTYIAHHYRVTQWPEWSQCYLHIYRTSLKGDTMAWMISVLPSHISHITTGWHNGLNDLSVTFTYIAHHCRMTQWPEWSQCYLHIYCTSLQDNTMVWMISVLPSHILHITAGWHNGLNDLSATSQTLHIMTQWPEWSQCSLHIYCTSMQGDTMAWMISVLPSHTFHITKGWHNGLNDVSATFTYISHH